MRKIFKIALVLLLIKIALFFVSLHYIDDLAKTYIERIATKVFKTNVSLGSVGISFLNGSLALKELKISNPSGYKSPHVAQVKKIIVKLDLTSFFKSVTKINELSILGPEFFIEPGHSGMFNTDIIKANLAKKNVAEAGSKSSEKTERKIIIDKVNIKDGTVNFDMNIPTKEISKTLKISDLQINGVGSEEGGIAISKATETIFRKILSQLYELNVKTIVDSNINKLIDKNLNKLKTDDRRQAVEGLNKILKGLIR